jgi:hypothetical protein
VGIVDGSGDVLASGIISVASSQSSPITVTNVTGRTVTVRYTGISPAAFTVYPADVNSQQAILNMPVTQASSGIVILTLPSQTPAGVYTINAVNAAGNAVTATNASGMGYPISQFLYLAPQ